MKKLPPTVICTGEFDFLRRDALTLIPKLQQAGRLLDVLDMPATRHSYESEVESAFSLLAEVETIRIWNRFVLDKEEKVRPAVSKNLYNNLPRKQGKLDEDVALEHDEHYPDMDYPPPWPVDDTAQREEYLGFVDPWLEGMAQEERYLKANDECDTEEITVPPGYGNIFPVRLMVHTPKNLKGKKG